MDKSGNAEGMIELTASNFEETINKDVVLVDFYGENCSSCKGQDIILNAVIDEIGNKVKFARVEAHKYLTLAGGRYGIKSLPTIIIFKDGIEVKRFAGMIGEEPLIVELNKALKK